jgi:hypothetical protein
MTVMQSAKSGKYDQILRFINGGSGTSNEGALGFRDLSAVNRRWL